MEVRGPDYHSDEPVTNQSTGDQGSHETRRAARQGLGAPGSGLGRPKKSSRACPAPDPCRHLDPQELRRSDRAGFDSL
eukprot:7468819-Pyramimonas_sp.AAC.1